MRRPAEEVAEGGDVVYPFPEVVLGTCRLCAEDKERTGVVVLVAWAAGACTLRRGLDKMSKRDIDWALPGLRSIRVPGVLDRDRPDPEIPPADGLALLKVMVGIKSVRRR